MKKGMMISDRYLIINILYDTDSKKIYEAYHLKLGIEVIIKKINLINKLDFSNEVSILKTIKHQYIPQIYDIINIEEDNYIIMEYIKGEDMNEILKKRKLSDEDIIRWTKQILMALEYMHNKSTPILHCDIKPSNIIINSDNDACLIDFNVSLILNGFANPRGFSKYFAAPEIVNYFFNANRKIIEDNNYSELNIEETLLLDDDNKRVNNDKNRYISDKNRADIKYTYKSQLNSGSNNKIDMNVVDSRADIYSIGALMYHMYTGKYYSENSDFSELEKLNIDRRIINIIIKSLNYFKEKRYTEVKLILDELRKL